MSLFDNFIKRFAVSDEEYRNKKYDEYRDSKNLSDADLEISKLNYNIKTNLRNVLEILEHFKQFLTYSDNLKMHKNDTELSELQDKIDLDPSGYQQISQENPIYTEFEYGNVPEISRGQFIPKTNMQTSTKTWKYVMDKPTLEAEIKSYLSMLNRDVAAIKSDINSLQEYINADDVTYPVEQFGEFKSVAVSLDEILQNINKFESQTEKGVALVQDSENLIEKILTSDKLRDVITKIITLETFVQVRFNPKLNKEKGKKVDQEETLRKFFTHENTEFKPSSVREKMDAEEELKHIQDVLSKNKNFYTLQKQYKDLNEQYPKLIEQYSELKKLLFKTQRDTNLRKDQKEEQIEQIQNDMKKLQDTINSIPEIRKQILESTPLSDKELEDIHSRESELAGVLWEGGKPETTESKEDSLTLTIYRIKNFLKEYGSYINNNSQLLFTTTALNEKFDKLVIDLNYWYNEVDKEYSIGNQVNITNEDIRNFLIEADFVSDKKNSKKLESDPEVSNLISNLIKFINELRTKIDDIKENIKNIFKDNTNTYDVQDSKTKYSYKLFVNYLKNSLITDKYIDSRALSNLYRGNIDKDILNEFKQSESQVIAGLQNGKISDYDLGLKVGLLYILYNAVNKLYLSTLDTRGKNTKSNSIFTRLKESVEKADISYGELKDVFKKLQSLYTTIENVLAPVFVAKPDFENLFKETNIAIHDNHANFIRDFDLKYMMDIIDTLESISSEVSKASEFVNSIMVNMNKDKVERDPELSTTSMETAVKLLNINEIIKNYCNEFSQYDLDLQTAINDLTKIKK